MRWRSYSEDKGSARRINLGEDRGLGTFVKRVRLGSILTIGKGKGMNTLIIDADSCCAKRESS